MMRKVVAIAILQVFIFSKQCISHGPLPEDITGITAKVNQRGIDFGKFKKFIV